MKARLCRGCVLAICAFTLGLNCAACSTSYQLGAFSGKDEAKAAQASVSNPPETTGSINSNMPPESDLIFARAAASEVLGRGGKDASTAWENPQSGARGTVTPIASAYSQDGRMCRDFLASYVHGGSEAWLQGEACKAGRAGKWEVRRLTPWKRS